MLSLLFNIECIIMSLIFIVIDLAQLIAVVVVITFIYRMYRRLFKKGKDR